MACWVKGLIISSRPEVAADPHALAQRPRGTPREKNERQMRAELVLAEAKTKPQPTPQIAPTAAASKAAGMMPQIATATCARKMIATPSVSDPRTTPLKYATSVAVSCGRTTLKTRPKTTTDASANSAARAAVHKPQATNSNCVGSRAAPSRSNISESGNANAATGKSSRSSTLLAPARSCVGSLLTTPLRSIFVGHEISPIQKPKWWGGGLHQRGAVASLLIAAVALVAVMAKRVDAQALRDRDGFVSAGVVGEDDVLRTRKQKPPANEARGRNSNRHS
jgi:hypothetical protein